MAVAVLAVVGAALLGGASEGASPVEVVVKVEILPAGSSLRQPLPVAKEKISPAQTQEREQDNQVTGSTPDAIPQPREQVPAQTKEPERERDNGVSGSTPDAIPVANDQLSPAQDQPRGQAQSTKTVVTMSKKTTKKKAEARGEASGFKGRVAEVWDGTADQREAQGGRLGLEAFLKSFNVESDEQAEFYRQLFSAAGHMMLPASDTLGRHCFSYAFLVAGEWDREDAVFGDAVFGKPGADSRVAAFLKEADDAWDQWFGDEAEQAMTEEHFVLCMEQHHLDKWRTATKEPYDSYLKSVYSVVMMTILQDPRAQPLLDQQGFRYAALMATEYYFKQAAETTKSACPPPCDEPVRDVLGLVA